MANFSVPFSSSNSNPLQIDSRMQEQSRKEDLGDIDSFCIEHGFCQENAVHQLAFTPNDQPLGKLQVKVLPSDLRFSSAQPILYQTRELKEQEEPSPFSASTELPWSNSSKFTNFKPEEVRNIINRPCVGIKKLSTEKIMRLAGERVIQFSSHKFITINMLIHPYGSALSNLSLEERQDVELAQLLLSVAEKVSLQQYERASKLLSQCESIASGTGTPAQRVVSYFAEALRERMDRETGILSPKRTTEHNGKYDVARSFLRYNAAFLALYQEVPFTQVMHFTAVQAILENVEMKPRVHVIDFHLRTGMQWAVLMQALGEQENLTIRHSRITAVETADKQSVEEIGKYLQNFARSLNLPFSFHVVFLSDIKDLRVEQFDTMPDEAIAVFASVVLRIMISNPVCLETLLRVVRSLDPCVMVVTEVEANHNSSSFINRFVQALFFYATFFDCLEDCMEPGDQHRMTIEKVVFREGIHNTVATEGRERTTRSVKIDVWRSFFAKFGMVEIELSHSSLFQANLLVQQFACGSSCTLEMNGRSLIMGWKGTPIHSVSVWKFD